MCLELGMLVYGLYGVYVLISGRFQVGKDCVMTGRKARALGVLCLSPFPMSMFLALLLVSTLTAMGIHPDQEKVIFTSIFMEASVLLVVLWFLVYLGNIFGPAPIKPSPKALVLLTGVVLFCTIIDVREYGNQLGPTLGDAVWEAALGTFIGSLGGVAFGLCTASELRRQSKLPAEVA